MTEGHLLDSVDRHLAEFRIALDPSHPRHILPPPLPASYRVLDVGCGAGQILIAAYPDRQTYGLDVNLDLLKAGTSLTGTVSFACGSAERMPYRDACFDAVIARVSLPYTNIGRSLQEIRRVLRPGGLLWATLQTSGMVWSRFRRAGWKDRVFCAYILINSMMFHLVQKEFAVLGRRETFQTARGIRKTLERAGFRDIAIRRDRHFLVTATVR